MEDAARGIVLAAERYDGRDPVNLGVGSEITIRDLTEQIARLTGFSGESGGTRPSPTASRGVPRHEPGQGGFRVPGRRSFEDGLRETIRWYEAIRRS